ncbi:Uncharacterized protein OBRU01_16289, partial [Operophtera brumata]
MWVAALFIDLLCRRGEYTMSLRCWDFLRWSCGRARAPFYACVATALLCEEMKVLDIKTPERPRSASPKQSLLEL